MLNKKIILVKNKKSYKGDECKSTKKKEKSMCEVENNDFYSVACFFFVASISHNNHRENIDEDEGFSWKRNLTKDLNNSITIKL